MCELEEEKIERILKKEIQDLRDDKELLQKELFRMNETVYDSNKKVELWEDKFKLCEKFFIELLRNDKLKKQNDELMKLLKLPAKYKDKITVEFK